MPDATITSTASTFGSISGTFAADQSTIAGTITAITGTIDGSVGVPGPQGPVGPAGATGPQGDPGAPGVGVPADGLEGQILAKASDTSYDTVWIDNSAVTLNATVRNESGSTMAAGTVVYITGASGNKAVVSKASASSEATSSKTFAILAESIPNNQNGTSVTVGLLKDIDTSALTEGGSLWLSTTAGQWTQTMPTAPNHAVFLGTVTRVHATQGEVEVRIQNGLELQELHNVKITSVANGQVLKYDSAQSLWVNGTDSSGVAWGAITGTLSSQTDLQTALDAKLPKAGGYITGDIQSSNNSAYRSWDGTYNTSVLKSDYLQLTNSGPGGNALTIEWNGITFPSGKQTVHYPGTSILSGYATESWVTSNFYPLTGNPSGFLTSASLSGYATESWVTSQGYITSAALTPYLTSATAASTYYPLSGNPSGFLTSASLSGYATESWVTTQLGSYLTTSTAASTYAPLASPTFTGTVTIPAGASISGYLTTASAASTYAALAGATFTGKVNTPAATTGGAGFSIAQGVAPTSPSNGDIWLTTTNVVARINGTTHTLPSLSSNNTFTGTATFSNASVNVGTSTATAGYSLGNGATISGSTKTVQIGTGGVAGSTTNITIGSTTGTSTTTLQGTTNGVTQTAGDSSLKLATTAFVTTADNLKANLASPTFTGTPAAPTAAADTNTTQLATTAFVVGQASSTSPVMDGTAAVGTSLKYARADHVHASDTSKADLASPTFTGTPSLPTGTIAVTQSAGNNTTAVATTAFVTAAVPAFGATADINSPSSTTKAASIANVRDMMLSPGYQLFYLGAGSSGTALSGYYNSSGGRYKQYQSSTTSGSYGQFAFDTNGSSIGYAGFTRGDAPHIHNWSKKIWLSGRCQLGNWNSGGNGDANGVARINLGGKNSFGSGDLNSTMKGMGWKVAGGGSAALVLQVSNGTTTTSVTSSFTPTLRQAFDWTLYSDGAGNVTLYVNDSQVATTSSGPTGTQTYGLYMEGVDAIATVTTVLTLETFGTKIYHGT